MRKMMVRSTAVSFLFLRVWLVLTLFGLTSLLLVGTSPGADKATFATGFRLNASYVLPPLTAMGKGFWKELGLDVEWVAFDSITDMQRAVAAGSISAGTVGVDNVITGNSQGIAEVIVADINERTEFFFWVPAASPLRRPEDLKKGALLGLSRYGQTTHWYSEIAVKNLGAEKQVKMVAVGGGTPAGIDVRKVVDTGILPVINTGIAHREAGVGQIGAGVTWAPMACFQQAVVALARGLPPVGGSTPETSC